jgi:hypothetical protein
MRGAHALPFAFVLGLAAWSQEAQAFSAADQFALPTSGGGGGGRFFTASYQDGYACSVCHSGGVPPVLRVSGLPVDGYQPGATYEIDVTWDKPNAHHGLNLELLGKDGNLPGQIALVDAALLDARGRCKDGKSPAFERTVGTRKVLGVEPCEGPSSLRFRFTPANVPELAFSASAIISDRQGTVTGDGVTTLRKVLRRVGEPAKTGDCSLGQSARGSLRSTLLVLVLVLVLAAAARLVLRRRRAR